MIDAGRTNDRILEAPVSRVTERPPRQQTVEPQLTAADLHRHWHEGVEAVLVTIEPRCAATDKPRILGPRCNRARPRARGLRGTGLLAARLRDAQLTPAGPKAAFFDLPMALASPGPAATPSGRALRLRRLAARTLLRAHGAVAVALQPARGRTLLLTAPEDAAQMALVPGVLIPVRDLAHALAFLRGS
jgi:hypothetical protein